MQTSRTIATLHITAMLVALAGVVAHIVGFGYGWLMLAIGAGAMFIVRLYIRARLTDKNAMRQTGMLMFGAVVLIAAAYLMYSGRRYWVIPLLIDAAVELYISFRLKS